MKTPLFRFILFTIIIYLTGLPTETVSIRATNQVINIAEPVPPPPAIRDAFELDPFYQQWIDVEGLPVVASAQVNPYALKEAAWQIWQMIGHRPDVLQVLAQKQIRFTVIGYTEILTDIPEYSDHIDFLTYRQRGSGGSGVVGHSAVTTSEENLLHYPGDTGGGLYNVLIHELAHAIHRFGLNTVDPTFDNRLKLAYDAAMEKGLWQGTYAASDRKEYWAEGTHAWFYPKGGGSFNNYGNMRDALKAYDPGLAALLAEIYGDTEWRYTPPVVRLHLPHLQGFNPENSPTFRHRPELEELNRQFRAPNSDGGDNWVDLRPYDPNLIPILNESRVVGNRTMMAFVNLTQAYISIYSVGGNGTERFWTRARPGRVRWTPSRTDVVWLIKDPNGKNLVAFQAEAQTGRAIVSTEMSLITPGLSKVSGDNQAGVSSAALPKPFVVEVRDENLSVLEGIPVTFTVVAGDGTLSVTHTTTNANGQAESPFTLGASLGTNTVSVSAAGVGQSVVFNVVAEAAVNIPDPNLRAVIEGELSKVTGAPITASEMATLTRLAERNANISNLTGLESATNLTTLDLDENNITDISPVVGLTNLTWLLLGGNNISDISVLAGLTNLTGLSLYNNNISDISAVTELTNLTNLWLAGNISDLSPLVANTGLGAGDDVDVRGNPLSYQSIYAHIPTLQRRGVTVEFNDTATKPPDVNGDGNVNVLDLILIASELGNERTNIAADIDGNGVVDILDLVLVAGTFEGIAAAPSIQPQISETITAVEVKQWLTQAGSLEMRDPIIKQGILVLEQLLISLTPTETELLANYPNPFNPETWIPYRLAEDAVVTLTIYDLGGRVVRTLNVGHRIASAYENRSKAVHWDGKNGLGEPVASGLYFYTLTAGDYSATRRMVILK